MVEESIIFTPEIPDRDLQREVRKVNDALADAGTINPELSGGGGGGGGGLSSGGPRSPLRRVSNGVDDLVPMADYRNRLLEDILDGVQGGGAGGGGGFISNLLKRIPGGRGLIKLLFGGTVALGALIASKLNPANLAEILGDKVGEVLPEDLVDPVDLVADDLVGTAATITAAALIAEKATIAAEDLFDTGTGEGNVTPTTDPLFEGLQPDPDAEVDPLPSGTFDPLPRGPTVGSQTVPTGFPGADTSTVAGAREQTQAGNIGQTLMTTALAASLPALGAVGGALGLGSLATRGAVGAGAIGVGTQGVGATETNNAAPNVSVSNTYQLDPSGMADLERQIDQKTEQAKREAINETERRLSGGGR